MVNLECKKRAVYISESWRDFSNAMDKCVIRMNRWMGQRVVIINPAISWPLILVQLFLRFSQ